MKGQPITYSEAELAWIRANAQRPRRAAHAEFQTRFGRPDVSLSNFKALCKRKGWMTGRTGQFEKESGSSTSHTWAASTSGDLERPRFSTGS